MEIVYCRGKVLLFTTNPNRLEGPTVGDNSLSSDCLFILLPIPVSIIEIRVWLSVLLAPNLYVSGETNSLFILFTVPHQMNALFFFFFWNQPPSSLFAIIFPGKTILLLPSQVLGERQGEQIHSLSLLG
jgi:hypothetical protein